MKNTKLFMTLISILFLLSFSSAFGQPFSKNSIKMGVGIGGSFAPMNYNEGFGFTYSFGYQRELKNSRIRLNPNFSIGHYSSRFTTDVPDLYFNSITIETIVFYDLIKLNAFSLVIGGGGLINNTRGLEGTGGFSQSNQTSQYINDFHWGGYLGGGFRINPPNKRIAINIMPFNFHIGNNDFAEVYAKLEMDVKL